MLDDVKHVEVCALLRYLLETPYYEVDHGPSQAWLEENHPPPAAYLAAMRSLVRGEEG